MYFRRWLIAAAFSASLTGGCQKTTPPPTAPTGQVSPPGWEIRYNAVTALARRGSDRVRDHLEVLGEMLDEHRQLQNFRTTLKDGHDVADEQAAHATVVSALKAVTELHEKKPSLDLSTLAPVIEKLTHSDNLIVRNEAERTRLALGKS